MRKLYTLVVSFLLLSVMAIGQQVPRGMKYQAVARDRAGEVLGNKKISLRISLQNGTPGGAVYYSEVHEMNTNQFGLFDLEIGRGKVEKGNFVAIPWSKEDIWMQVSLKDNQRADFITISSSKLLAVPYAFHAMTASELVKGNKVDLGNSGGPLLINANEPNNSGSNPSQGNSWNTGGNLGTNPLAQYLGTADNVMFIIKTNNVERMRVAADGNINIKRTLTVGADLNVDSAANLNRTMGATTNYGPFTVGGTYPAGSALRRSPTLLKGSLTVEALQPTILGGTLAVDKATQLNSTLTVAGATNLNSSLDVNNASPTRLTGTLQVDGETDLNARLRVNNMAPTILTGTLNGQMDATFNKKVLIDTTLNADTLSATVSEPNGALVTMGGAWINRNIVIQGDARIGGNTSFAGPVRITDGTQSTSTTTGALTVGGGTGIGKNLNVRGAVKLDSTLNVVGNSTLGGTLTVAQPTILNSTLQTNGQVTINKALSGGDQSYDAYPLRVQGSEQGIAIKVTGENNINKNYVSFFDETGAMQGRIEGNTLTQMKDGFEFRSTSSFLKASLAIQVIEAAIGVAASVQGGVKVVAASTSSTACVGLGACFTAPIPSLIVESGSSLILDIANVAILAANVAATSAELDIYVSEKESTFGVSFESGSGDYAEWLPRENAGETFKPGEIVAIRNGKISKNTDGASQLLVISYKPIVLGNMPKEGSANEYEKVAFMGQVPVYVLGTVEKGDYIIADGLGDGFGVAINPSKLKMEHYKKIVGVAWSSSKGKAISMVNVAIGLNRNDMADVLQEQQAVITSQQAEINELKAQTQQTNNLLAKLVPGFKEAAGIKEDAVISAPVAMISPAVKEQLTSASNLVTPDPTSIAYHEITDAQIEEMFTMAEKVFLEAGGKYNEHPFWKKVKSQGGYKASIKNEVKERMKNAVHYHKDANKKLHKH